MNDHFESIKIDFALDADPRMPLGCIIIHQEYIVAGADHNSGLIFVWSFNSNMRFKQIKILQGHQSNIIALLDLISSFASCSKDGTLRIWKDFDCVVVIPKCHGIEKYPTSLACYYPPDQRLPYLFSGGTDGLIVSYDVKNGRASNVAGGHSGWILCLTCKNDGPFLFSGSTDCTVRLWDAVTLQFLYAFSGHSDSIHAISTFETYLVSGDRAGEIRVFDMFTSECLNIFNDHCLINSLQIYRRDRRIRVLSMGHGNYLCEWDTLSNGYNCVNKFHFGTIRSSIFFKNWIFTAARDGAVGVWSLKRDDSVAEYKVLELVEGNELFPELDLSLKNDWNMVQKAFQELNQLSLKQRNEIFSLRAEVFDLKLNQNSLKEINMLPESNHFLACINDMLDSHLKNASHQLVKSAILLEEMRYVLCDNTDLGLNVLMSASEFIAEGDTSGSDSNELLSQEFTLKVTEDQENFNKCWTGASNPMVLSASSGSECTSSYDSDLCDDLSLYYGTQSYRDESFSDLGRKEFGNWGSFDSPVPVDGKCDEADLFPLQIKCDSWKVQEGGKLESGLDKLRMKSDLSLDSPIIAAQRTLSLNDNPW